jgi:hypothetical protein
MLVRVERPGPRGPLKPPAQRPLSAYAVAVTFVCCVAVAGCGGDASSDPLPWHLGPMDAEGGGAVANSATEGAVGGSGSISVLGLGGSGASAGSVYSGGSISSGGSGVESVSGSGGSSGGAQLGSAGLSSGPTLAGAGCPPLSGSPPAWSSIWSLYGFSNSCHTCHKQASRAASAYTWLQQLGQINGIKSPIATAYSPLVVQNTSVLVLFGGDMPKSGTAISAAAKCALVAWVVAGAPNN